MNSGGLFEEVRYWDESLSAFVQGHLGVSESGICHIKHLKCSLSFGFILCFVSCLGFVWFLLFVCVCWLFFFLLWG